MTIPENLRNDLLAYENLTWMHRDVAATGPQVIDYLAYLTIGVERHGRITDKTLWEAMVHTETGSLATRQATHLPGSYDPKYPEMTDGERAEILQWICYLTHSEGAHVGPGQISDPAALEIIRAADIDIGLRLCPTWSIVTWPDLREACAWHKRARNAARTTSRTAANPPPTGGGGSGVQAPA